MPLSGEGRRASERLRGRRSPWTVTRMRGYTRMARQMLVMALPWMLVVLVTTSWPTSVLAMRDDRIAQLRRETVSMFYHGYDNYMRVAFPEDELRPISCTPLTRDSKSPHNVALNDVLGNYSLTLIDSLSTLAILASAPPEDGDVGPKALSDFQDGVASLVQQYGDGRRGPSGQGQRGRGFDLDSKVQVFETVIRGVGGLLSAHLFAVGELPIAGYVPPEQEQPAAWPNGLRYDGQLLRLAQDLATRLLPAFYTPTGMPYPRVNLRYGIPFYHNSPLHGPAAAGKASGSSSSGDGTEITETCSAGAGSLVLELTVLSRLTGDQRFEQVAKRAFWAVWYRRSAIGLIGAGVDAEQGRWIGTFSVIGAGADSFFEYALKAHILLSGHELPNSTQLQARPASWPDTAEWLDPNAMFPQLSEAENSPDSFLEAWNLAHAAIKRHLYSDREHPHYVNVNIWTGSLASQWIDSLGAYYQGLLTLAGELEEAVETNLLYTAVWAKYAALPERWSITDKTVEGGLGWWPLRPEFIESTYHIYRATRDPWYLYVGEMVQRDIGRRCWTACGWAGLQNVLDGEKTDRMESFFLGETVKYMYLLYDDRHPLNSLDAAYVFTTEGHPLIIPRKRQQHNSSSSRNSGSSSGSEGEGRSPKAQEQAQTREQNQASAAPPLSYGGLDVGHYDDGGFTNTCPLPPQPSPLTGSAITARTDIYHAARLLDLHLATDGGSGSGNPTTQPLESGRPGSSSSPEGTFLPWTLPPTMLPSNGTCAKVMQPLEMSLEFAAAPQDKKADGGGWPGGPKGGGKGGGSSFNFMLGKPTMDRIAHDKIRVLSVSGLKLLFRLDEERPERMWRVTRVNGIPLGRDESIVIDRALLSHISDARFSLVRDPIVVKLHHLHHVVQTVQEHDEDADDDDDGEDDDDGDGEDGDGAPVLMVIEDGLSGRQADGGLATLVRSFWRQIVSSLDGQPHATAAPGKRQGRRSRSGSKSGRGSGAGNRGKIIRSRSIGSNSRSGSRKSAGREQHVPANMVRNATGVTATGLGAAPLPPVDVPAGAAMPATGAVPAELLPWTTVFAGGTGCDGPLPETAARDHQVLVLRRGGCSFSEKLARVPAFAPSRRGLQLVVVVSDDDDVAVSDGGGGSGVSGDGRRRRRGSGIGADGEPVVTFHDDADDFVRPLLDEAQKTPGGLPRRHQLAMVMVGGGDAAYAQIAGARQLGLTRRYMVESQGVRVRNVLIDDGDAA